MVSEVTDTTFYDYIALTIVNLFTTQKFLTYFITSIVYTT